MSLTHEKNEYAIPRGRVYFDPFDANQLPTGEIYLGNCPGFTLQVETEKAEHYSSEEGLREKDEALVVQVNRTGNVTCDNFSADNLALFLSGAKSTTNQAAATIAGEAHSVGGGLYYQLGETNDNPSGARDVTDIVVTSADGATTYDVGDDYNVDPALGRVQIVKGGAIDIAAAAAPSKRVGVSIGYKTTARAWTRVTTGSKTELSGRMRVVASNASGTNRDWFMPKVTLTPSGEIPVIAEGTEFVQMQFGLEVLKAANTQAVYVDGRGASIP
ncbi:hypothetical protein [Acidovorax sp. A1169]|uniref:phage tail tube protein n=1 Tax=Acidovorax sp. A1169 TaxID=3059524 RepID=UPI0027378506|nr:hypothetical protein [Acidovorax sp. A1169]MDP4074954.1 hypothetical protein [Acidovorax sp. A1169]